MVVPPVAAVAGEVLEFVTTCVLDDVTVVMVVWEFVTGPDVPSMKEANALSMLVKEATALNNSVFTDPSAVRASDSYNIE